MSASLSAAQAQPAYELNLGASAGYDSNPAQWHESPGLAFSRASLDASRHWILGAQDLTLGMSGWYRDLEGPNDSYRLAAQSIWSRPMANGSGLLSIGGTLAAYRDRLVPEDSRNEAILEVRYDQALSARDMLGLSLELGGMRYLTASESCADDDDDEPQQGQCAGQGGRGGKGRHAGHSGSREDRQAGLAIDLTHHWSPEFSTMLSVASVRHESPLPIEAYSRNALGLTLEFDGPMRWNLEVGLGWSEAAYDRAPRHQDRRDVQWTAGLAARRTWSNREASCSLNWLESDSTVATRSYRQLVTQCGLSWSF